MSTTRDVANWVANLQHADVPAHVRRALRLLALDTVGAALVGADQPWTKAIRAWALAAAPGPAAKGRARIWGENQAVLRAADAALVNGAAAPKVPHTPVRCQPRSRPTDGSIASDVRIMTS